MIMAECGARCVVVGAGVAYTVVEIAATIARKDWVGNGFRVF